MTCSKLGLTALLVVAGMVQACAAPAAEEAATSSEEIRSINEREALADLDALGMSLRLEYGPLELKAARFGFDLDTELAVASTKIRAARTEPDRIRPFYELLAKLKDGHVAFTTRLRGDDSVDYAISGLFLTPIQGEYYVAGAPPPRSGLVAGDRVVSIDGLSTQRIEQLLFSVTEIGTRASTLHRIGTQLTARPFYVPSELIPRGPSAHIVAQHADGSEMTVDLPWTAKAGIAGQVMIVPAPPPTSVITDVALSPHLVQLNEVMATSLQSRQSTPFFLTTQVRERLGIVDVVPTKEALAKFGVMVTESVVPSATSSFDRFPMRGYKYQANGKRVLLTRIPAFTVSQQNYDENVAWLAALLSENEGDSDVVIVDVSHNPGGSVPYVAGLASLFLKKPSPNMVQATRASRSQVANLLQSANFSNAEGQPIWLARLTATEAAFDRGDHLAPFAPMSGTNLAPTIPFVGLVQAGKDMLDPHPLFHWTKPILVLHDELSGSGGDAFPLIMQHSGVKTFGATTAGMGGSVHGVLLPATGNIFSFTRGLFGTYDPDPTKIDLAENDGVSPDFPHELTITDFRAGYVEYADAFTKVATSLAAGSPP